MSWSDLFPELQNIIRTQGTRLDQTMLRWTCKQESAISKDRYDEVPVCILFWDACGDGALSICKLIYAVPKAEWTDLDGRRQPGSALFYYDEALRNGHFDVAQWAFDEGLPLRIDTANSLARSGSDDGVKWMWAHNLPLGITGLHSVHSHALRMWLVGTCGIKPADRDLFEVLWEMRGSEEDCILLTVEAQYYLSLGCKIDIGFCDAAVTYGKWALVDFVQRYIPLEYSKTLLRIPLMDQLLRERPEVAWNQEMNLTTGLVFDVCPAHED